MRNYLEEILLKLESKKPDHAKKLRLNTNYLNELYVIRANDFYFQYEKHLLRENADLDFSIDCYLRMLDDMAIERMSFLRQGKYSSGSFEEVQKCIYSNPDMMCYHMHGLALAQFLWFDQYERYSFFADKLAVYAKSAKSYLEIGGGHGLYCSTAIKLLSANVRFEVIDISEYSIRLSKGIINDTKVNFITKNVLEYASNSTFDFITMGEVLEHMEDPLVLLKKLKDLISDDGISYISTPVNAPMIDHIFLFNEVQEIRDMINLAGLEIIEEKVVISEHVSQQYADKFKVPVMFAAFIKQKQK
jgi:2-polyprenyl-3-methyl-5-hydroxy-6-metoxy-1,4-benzoquinol methylase